MFKFAKQERENEKMLKGGLTERIRGCWSERKAKKEGKLNEYLVTMQCFAEKP